MSTDPAEQKSAIDAVVSIAQAVEANAMALVESAAAVRELVEHFRDKHAYATATKH